MVSLRYADFASLDVVCDELHDCAWNIGISFLISVCMFIVLKASLISSATLIVHAVWNHLVEPLCDRVI